jgi:predicted nuclease of predicted toxin-antitoxin system
MRAWRLLPTASADWHRCFLRFIGPASADDAEVWDYERRTWTFVSEAFYWAPPPKVVSLALGNCSTSAIEQALRIGLAELAQIRGRSRSSIRRDRSKLKLVSDISLRQPWSLDSLATSNLKEPVTSQDPARDSGWIPF